MHTCLNKKTYFINYGANIFKEYFFTSYIKSITLFSYANLTLYMYIYSCEVSTYENINGSIVNLCCLSSTCVFEGGSLFSLRKNLTAKANAESFVSSKA